MGFGIANAMAQVQSLDQELLNAMGVAKKKKNKCLRRCGEKGTLLHGLWECKSVHPLRKTEWSFYRKLRVELPYDPAMVIAPGHIFYLNRTIIQKDTHTPIFIAALFAIAKTWKQSKCPPDCPING